MQKTIKTILLIPTILLVVGCSKNDFADFGWWIVGSIFLTLFGYLASKLPQDREEKEKWDREKREKNGEKKP